MEETNTSSVQLIDSDADLELYSYVRCENETPLEVQQSRGLIYTKNKGELIVPNFGYTKLFLYQDTEMSQVPSLLKEDWSSWMFTPSYEGTLLRCFHWKGEWHIATNRKLDAYRSRWGSRYSFGELMEQALNKTLHLSFAALMSRLDPVYVYFFLLRATQETRIVCQVHPKMDRIYFLGRSPKGDFQYEMSPDLVPEVPRARVLDIATLVEFQQTLSTMDAMECQGLLATHKVTGEQIKWVLPQYAMLSEIRGNHPNLRFRYLEVRQNAHQLKLLYFLYPRYTEIFDSYEEILVHISRLLYQFYVNRYIKNRFITLPREEYRILKKCHEYYLQNKQIHRIYSKKILEIMNEEPALHLYKMIRRFLSSSERNGSSSPSHTRKAGHAVPSSYHSSLSSWRDRERGPPTEDVQVRSFSLPEPSLLVPPPLSFMASESNLPPSS